MVEALTDEERIRQILHALLLEWTLEVEVHRGRNYIDFVTSSLAPLGVNVRQRFRLFFGDVDEADFGSLRVVCQASEETPVVVVTQYPSVGPSGMFVIGPAELDSLVDQSTVLTKGGDGSPAIESSSLGDLSDERDTRLALVNGLLWLRPLARNRVPPALRPTGRPAHELFERCFFTVLSSTFAARGTSWGTNKRGEVRPDGLLDLPNAKRPTIYDCKASLEGYTPTHQDILSFADYVNNPVGWTPPGGPAPRFLVISSGFQMRGRGSFTKRRDQLLAKASGVDLVTIRARDLVRFGVELERASLRIEGRMAIDWGALLDAGEVQWQDFELQLDSLRAAGFGVGT